MLKYSLGVFSVTCCLLSSPAFAQSADPTTLFSEGKSLLEVNCPVCYKNTAEGFEAGIAKVVEAIDKGYEDKPGAYKVLAEAYRVYGVVYAEPDSAEKERYYESFRAIFRKILALEPNETEMRFLYAESFRDEERRNAEYREILKVDPDHFYARHAIGITLIERYVRGIHMGDPVEAEVLERGLEAINRAIGTADIDQAGLVEMRAIPTLRSVGLVAQADLLAQNVRRRVTQLQ